MNPVGVAIGIDGGASSLKWSVRDRAGRLAHGQSLGANQTILDWQTYTGRLNAAISAALETAQAAPADITSLGMGLAGVDRPAEAQRLTSWLGETYPALQGRWVGNDALPALRQGAGRLAGIIVIAGTGSICTGVTEDGRIIRSGGWGGSLGDEGSGFWIGRNALEAACQMADGRRPRTALLDEVLAALKLHEPTEMIPWVQALDADQFKRRVATIAPVVFRLAAAGDSGARRIFRLAVAQLRVLIFTIARRLDEMEMRPSARTVVCAGGLFEHFDAFYEALTASAERRQPPLTLVRLQEPASLGALHLGLEHPLDV